VSKDRGNERDLVARHQLARKEVVIESEVLGRGNFGVVYPGSYRNRAVAFKTSQDDSDTMSMPDELKVLAYLQQNPHPHIIHLIGIHLNPTGKMYLVVELCPLGNLREYLTTHGQHGPATVTAAIKLQGDDAIIGGQSTYAITQDQITDSDQGLGPELMLTWSRQIADAMEFMSSRKVVHGDLAARNVLLKERAIIKLTDFGLSGKLYADVNYAYTPAKGKPLAFRWLPLEALTTGYSAASDVWSFGVTLWEIYNHASQPFSEYLSKDEYMKMLEEHRVKDWEVNLEKPVAASDDMYE
jgi:serine/threonine protein kinase